MVFPVPQDLLLLNREAWNCNATSSNVGPEKTLYNRYGNSSPRLWRENHYAFLLYDC